MAKASAVPVSGTETPSDSIDQPTSYAVTTCIATTMEPNVGGVDGRPMNVYVRTGAPVISAPKILTNVRPEQFSHYADIALTYCQGLSCSEPQKCRTFLSCFPRWETALGGHFLIEQGLLLEFDEVLRDTALGEYGDELSRAHQAVAALSSIQMESDNKILVLLDFIPSDMKTECAKAAVGIAEFEKAASAITKALRTKIQRCRIYREGAIGQAVPVPTWPFLARYPSGGNTPHARRVSARTTGPYYRPISRLVGHQDRGYAHDPANLHPFALNDEDSKDEDDEIVASGYGPACGVRGYAENRSAHPVNHAHAVVAKGGEEMVAESSTSRSRLEDRIDSLVAAVQTLQENQENGGYCGRLDCLVCRSTEHRKPQCDILKRWLRENKVIINDMGHVAFPDGRTVKIEKSGMIAAVEREQARREAAASSSN
ncbi:hypothetical protein EV183_005610 [Coemansia sp. RSA 2336]|nr:hypothetical protein EV183_005610 [Coemansia sp. RSA 2336]